METNTSKTKYCYFCGSEEGKPRPVGKYIVELKPVKVKGVYRLACQSCFVKTTVRIESSKRHHKSSERKWLLKLKALIKKF